MQVIYLHQYFNTPDMMGGTRSFEIGRRLVAAGHTVDIVTSWREASEKKDWFITEEEGMRVHWLPVPYSNYASYGSRLVAFIRFAVAAARRAAGLEGDVIFATSTPLTISIPAVYAARRKKVPMVFEVRDLWPELPIAVGALTNPVSKWAARKLEKFSYENASRVVALSPGIAAGVVDAGYPESSISIVPNSSDLDLFNLDSSSGMEFRRKLAIDDNVILVGYTGTIGRINGVGYLVRLAAALKADTRFRFVVVGDGQERPQVEALAADLGVLQNNFLLLPGMTKEEIPQVLSAVDIALSLFLPIREMESNSANKFFDALAAGCCVAINYGGWQAELLKEAAAGIQLSSDPHRAEMPGAWLNKGFHETSRQNVLSGYYERQLRLTHMIALHSV
jgi:glycosyltransferase involved in cell wall biosynthesis